MSLITLILGIVMLASLWFIVDFWQRDDPRFLLLIIFFFCINVLTSLFILYYTNVIGSRAQKLYRLEEAHYTTAKSYVLGKYLADKYPKSRALIIAEPDYKKNWEFAALLKGFQKAFENKIEIGTVEGIVVSKATKPGEKPLPLWKVMQAIDFDKMIANHPECNLVISTVGLPEDLHRMDIWYKSDNLRPKLAVINSYMFVLKKVIQQKFVVAAVSGCPNRLNDELKPPDSLEKTFDMRYILVTPENIDDMMKKYQVLFLTKQGERHL